MGILNLTPDSFSDGGRFNASEAALARAKQLVAEGADLIDIGAESTRPGYRPVSAAEELARLDPLLGKICRAVNVPVSIDTMKAEVARRAVALGATIVNDIWGLRKDPAMADTIAETGAGLVMMHNREDIDAQLDILADLHRFFDRSLHLAEKAGIPSSRIMLDPGIGFGKTAAQNLLVLRELHHLRDYGLPILVGVSRKSFIGALLDADVDHRLIGTLAANLVAATRGASVFRVHDVAEHVAAFKIFSAIRNARAHA
ncbi:dihydropteroate synthase [Beijerinckia indica]|uniref:dihydropteroate synthase n=1 Tax=Beijerinckia indica subsp. indica (strain ATCC 9039 / DSM 1715 / NCIMB 8712) TaxID=395963 RepID=B2IBT3_BEII9|nr:dihydropteroate synthase [Beijerinckia indica]ACB93805.1 dihydropteroate synthase [Beijerinckia indica subsp. indica ATCC 9039]